MEPVRNKIGTVTFIMFILPDDLVFLSSSSVYNVFRSIRSSFKNPSVIYYLVVKWHTWTLNSEPGDNAYENHPCF